jgi:CDP-diglyceride synthetase
LDGVLVTDAINQLIAAIALLFACGAAFICCLALRPATRPTAMAFWRLFADEALIVAPVVAIAFFGSWAALILLAALAVRAAIEIGGPWRSAGNARLALLMLGGWIALFLWASARFTSAGTMMPFLLTYVIIETADSSALLFGRLFGTGHPFPKLSPGKTTAGCVAGILAGVLTGTVLAWQIGSYAPEAAIVLASIVVVAGFTGDLIVSMIKRRLGIKDFPPVLRRHGGVIDIYDSFLFALPWVVVAVAALD